MATSFKTFLNSDITTTRTLLHEAVPITGAVVSGTYLEGGGGSDYTEVNQKTYSHGMFTSIYDYPYLSSSANHIMDITFGYSNSSAFSSSVAEQNAKKINVYNQMAQMLAGYDESGSIRDFDIDGDFSTTAGKMKEVYFINLARLLTKDEIKKGSFALEFAMSGAFTTLPRTNSSYTEHRRLVRLTDVSGSDGFKTNSPAGEYGVLFASGSGGAAHAGGTPGVSAISRADTHPTKPAGLIFYQAGIAVVTASLFNTSSVIADYPLNDIGLLDVGNVGTMPKMDASNRGIQEMISQTSINALVQGFAHRLVDVDFNNTTELNSTVYFCRANHNEFNYSSNPTYLSSSKMVVKNSTLDSPVTYLTTVGMYSANNELLAVAKLSEPIKKDPTNEVTLRVRLDY